MVGVESLKTKYLKNKFSRDTIWLIMAQLVLMASGLGVNLIIGGLGGAADLGVFNQSMAYYTILATLFAFGLNNTLIKKIAEGNRNADEESQLFTANILTVFVLSALFTCGAIFLAIQFSDFFSSKELASVVYIPFFALPFFNANKNFMAYYTGKRNQKQFSLERIIRWVIIGCFVSFVYWRELGVTVALYAFLAAEIVLFFHNCIGLAKVFRFSFNIKDIYENLKFGMKSYVSEIIAVINSSVDLILIGYFLSSSEVGVYSFIAFFVKTLYIFPGILMQNVNPIISNLWFNNQIDLLKERLSALKIVNAKIILLQFLFLLVFYWLVIMLVKQEFIDSYPYFVISIIGVSVFALVYWGGSMLIMAGKLRENILRTLLSIVISLLVTVIFSYHWQLLGACIAVSLNGLISFLMTKVFIKKVLRINLI